MKFRIITTTILLLSFSLFAQSYRDPIDELLFFSDETTDSALEDDSSKSNKDDESGKLDKANLDMQVVYGQYNNMLSTINLSQERGGFAYILKSNYKRSNDYGYKDTVYNNSSYFENLLEFTGNVSFSDRFSSIFTVGVENDSRGMFDKLDYSREEKDKVTFYSKNTRKFSQNYEAYVAFDAAFYKHRLEGRDDEAEPVRNYLTRYAGEVGGEYIWSSSNRISYMVQGSQYNYSEQGIGDDRFVHGQIVDDFKITGLFGANVGINTAWSKDSGLFAWDLGGMPLPLMPIAGVTFYGNDYYTVYTNYRYTLESFRPEEYYYSLNYISPTYNLPPARVHYADIQLDVMVRSAFTLKSIFSFENSDNFYNYLPSENSDNLLTAHAVEAEVVSFSTDLDLNIIGKTLRLLGSYQFKSFHAKENITYLPSNTYTLGLRYEGDLLKVDWTNNFLGEVYVDPEDNRTLDNSTMGYLDIQFKTIESFYAYLRLENLYNSRYYIRDGYPEAGLTVLFGLRIIL
ncbi:MAG: hypothetical protein PF637_02835 [Spirochaetes bacterium]|jgi:hypothetical protein|nr:hypothetical protein [Spirochaetota bacterium]